MSVCELCGGSEVSRCPAKNETTRYWSETLQAWVTIPEDDR